MSEPIVSPANSGQELQLSDVDNIGAVSGLADDRVLAELLRLLPTTGSTVFKAVLPASGNGLGVTGASPDTNPVVSPSGSANGSIAIAPFRAVVGSRNAANAAPSPNPAGNYQSDAMANWRDIRSAIYTGSGTALFGAIALAANSSGNPRWDLVYATVAVDANGPSVSRRQKAPSTGVVTVASVPAYLQSTVSVAVVAGTPGATPALPVLPVDAAGNYNIPLAWVRVPNGFSSSSTVATTDIRSNVLANNGASSISRYAAPWSGTKIEVANGNNDGAGTYATNFPWSASAGGRPGPFLPPDWVGGRQLLVEIDALTPGSYSHTNGSIVDDTVDWRYRIFPLVMCQASTSAKFANDVSGATTVRLPVASPTTNTAQVVQMSSSCAADAILGAGTACVSDQSNSNNSAVTSGAGVGLYVDMSSGVLKAFISGSPGCRLVFFVMATAPFPNL